MFSTITITYQKLIKQAYKKYLILLIKFDLHKAFDDPHHRHHHFKKAIHVCDIGLHSWPDDSEFTHYKHMVKKVFDV